MTTTSTNDDDEEEVSQQRGEQRDDDFVSAKYFFDDFFPTVLADPTVRVTGTDIQQLMQDYIEGDSPVPPISIITQWINATVYNIDDDNDDDDDWGEESTNTTVQSSTNNSVVAVLEQKRNPGALLDSKVVYLGKYAWAHDYFNKLMDEGHMMSTAPEVFELIVEHSHGTQTLPKRNTVATWLCAARSMARKTTNDLDDDVASLASKKHHCRFNKYAWAHDYFKKLMDEGHMMSTAPKELELIMDHGDGTQPVPKLRTVADWLAAARSMSWAYTYFNKLMKEARARRRAGATPRLLKHGGKSSSKPGGSKSGGKKSRAGELVRLEALNLFMNPLMTIGLVTLPKPSREVAISRRLGAKRSSMRPFKSLDLLPLSRPMGFEWCNAPSSRPGYSFPPDLGVVVFNEPPSRISNHDLPLPRAIYS